MRKTVLIATILATGLAAASARAEAPKPGSFVLSAERFVGVYREVLDPDQGDSVTLTSARLTWGPAALTPYSAPRVGFDYVLDSGLSLGGGAGIATYHLEEGDDEFALLLAPRVGYVFALGADTGFWLRGGLTLFNFDESDVDGLAITGEGMFAIGLTDTFGLLLGPVFDFGLSGNYRRRDVKPHMFGIAVGLAGWM